MVERVDIYLGLGSNIGERRENIAGAVEALEGVFGAPPEARSGLYETAPWGFRSEHPFLNGCVLFSVSGGLSGGAAALLREIKRIEREAGRPAGEASGPEGPRIYKDRIIDIDILFYGTERIVTRTLTVPHPLIRQRDFVLRPLREIAKPALTAAFPEIFA